jgi:hypothetical protein
MTSAWAEDATAKAASSKNANGRERFISIPSRPMAENKKAPGSGEAARTPLSK